MSCPHYTTCTITIAEALLLATQQRGTVVAARVSASELQVWERGLVDGKIHSPMYGLISALLHFFAGLGVGGLQLWWFSLEWRAGAG